MVPLPIRATVVHYLLPLSPSLLIYKMATILPAFWDGYKDWANTYKGLSPMPAIGIINSQ